MDGLDRSVLIFNLGVCTHPLIYCAYQDTLAHIQSYFIDSATLSIEKIFKKHN